MIGGRFVSVICGVINDWFIAMEEMLSWRMTKRYTFTHHSLFKVKQVAEDAFMTHIPNAKRVNFYDFQFTPLPTHLEFSNQLQAIDHFEVQGRQFVFAGLKNGVIQGQQLTSAQGQQWKMQLRLEEETGNNVFINDMLQLGEGRLVNCYNSGNIAIWDVSLVEDKTQPIAYMKNVHQDFIYKLRRVDRQRIVSCGNDQFVNLIDLETAKVIDSYYHLDSVWCCYPIDQNCLVSAGLLGYLSFWDVRSGNMVQTLQLLTSQTSFVTRLDDHNLVFGDRRQVSRCDLRKVERQKHCEVGMKVSAESIIVTQNGGVIVGRGGDMCLFEKGGEQGQVEEKNLQPNNTNYQLINNPYRNFLAALLHLPQQNVNIAQEDSDEDEEQEQDENEQLFLEQDDDSDDSSENELM